MRDEANGYLGFGIFFLIIALIVFIGSYTLYNDSFKKDEKNIETMENDKTKEKQLASVKIDKNKDLIYFQNEEVISEALGITYKEVAFNFKNSEVSSLQEKLQNEVVKLKEGLTKVETTETTCDDNIKKAFVRDYAIFTSDNYTSLIISDSDYTCENSFSIINKMQSYTFNNTDGKLLSEDELLKIFNLTKVEMLKKIENHLVDSQNENATGGEIINIPATINNLKYNENYMLYLNELGKLEVKYIVKSSLVDYNDTIIF